ncbi:MAP kinaseactivated protein kinase 2like, partial [Caligus rogercresseyi]
QYTAVPQTPLLTCDVLKEENAEMSSALREMRFDHDTNFTVKNPSNSDSALVKKRRNKTAGTVPSTIAEQVSTSE